jgi:hypothetical protein
MCASVIAGFLRGMRPAIPAFLRFRVIVIAEIGLSLLAVQIVASFFEQSLRFSPFSLTKSLSSCQAGESKSGGLPVCFFGVKESVSL